MVLFLLESQTKADEQTFSNSKSKGEMLGLLVKFCLCNGWGKDVLISTYEMQAMKLPLSLS